MDRITRLYVENVRSIEALEVTFAPVTVLIGENGAGKSTILECLELLRCAAEPNFFDRLYSIHRGVGGLVRAGASDIFLRVDVESGEGLPGLTYMFGLVVHGGRFAIETEVLLERSTPGGTILMDRVSGYLAGDAGRKRGRPPEDTLLLSSFGFSPPPGVDRMLAALRAIQVHLSFDTTAAWAAQLVQRPSALRGSLTVAPTKSLSLFGRNLANAWFALKDREKEHVDETMWLARAGLGDDLEAVLTPADPGGGMIALALRFRGLAEPIPAANLSEGQLAWLAYVALARLHNGNGLLALDEPELHMHPALLARLVAMMSHLDGPGPILFATHADAVLDMLDDPAASVRICRLEGRKTVMERLDKARLDEWLERFTSVGSLRNAGYLNRAIAPSTPAEGAKGREP